MLAFDAGLKYRGIFLQTENYNRWLDEFDADGPLPVSLDPGHRLLRAGRVLSRAEKARALCRDVADLRRQGCRIRQQLRVPRRHELSTWRTRATTGSTLQVIDVERSPVSSTFGYYVGGQKGTTISAAFSVFF